MWANNSMVVCSNIFKRGTPICIHFFATGLSIVAFLSNHHRLLHESKFGLKHNQKTERLSMVYRFCNADESDS